MVLQSIMTYEDMMSN